jgi:hypothetical protein
MGFMLAGFGLLNLFLAILVFGKVGATAAAAVQASWG